MEAVANATRLFESVKEGSHLTITRRDVPWLPTESERIRLKRVGVSGGAEFYLASATRGKKLVEAASELDEHRSKIANSLFNSRISEFIRGYAVNVKTLIHSVAKRTVYYVGNPGGQRVYFMRFDNMDGLPVIIRIAACDKSAQTDVLSVLTDQPIRNIKKFARI